MFVCVETGLAPAVNAQERRTENRVFFKRVKKKKRSGTLLEKKREKKGKKVEISGKKFFADAPVLASVINFKELFALAIKNMKFSSIELSTNSRLVHIPHKPFLIALVKNLNLRHTYTFEKNRVSISSSSVTLETRTRNSINFRVSHSTLTLETRFFSSVTLYTHTRNSFFSSVTLDTHTRKFDFF